MQVNNLKKENGHIILSNEDQGEYESFEEDRKLPKNKESIP